MLAHSRTTPGEMVLAHSRTTPGEIPATATLGGFPSSAEPQGTCTPTAGAARPFPPPAGLTFSCWFLVSRHSSALEGHPLRFLTLVRHLARTEQPFVCFSVSLCPDDLSLVVSTEEKEFQPLGRPWNHSWFLPTWGTGWRGEVSS